MATGCRFRHNRAVTALKVFPVVIGGLLIWGYSAGLHQAPLRAQAPSATSPPGGSSPVTQGMRPLLQTGDAGEAVRKLQAELNRVGVFSAPPDGIYGPATEAAVRNFQQNHGLTPDGVVGTETRQTLALAQNPNGMFDPQTFPKGELFAFTPLNFSQPAPPPSPLWLVLMPLVPLLGGALTYLQRRLRGKRPKRKSIPGASRRRARKKRHPRRH